jgi:hypothetical protein
VAITGRAPARRTRRAPARKAEVDHARTYNRFKVFAGKRYTGMAVGRSHTWRYDAGEWKERKVAPDRWDIRYEVTKRRKGRAPEGSGAPVGTEYHWYIVAHQVVRKLNANDYATALSGAKYKLAHKRAGAEAWNISDPAQRKQLIRVLEKHLEELRRPVPTPEETTPPPAKRVARRTRAARTAVATTR